jgi:transposase/DUF971 family protein
VIDYDTFCRLQQLRSAGRTPPQIAQEMNLHIQTVRGWLARKRFTRSEAAQRPRPSKLDAHKPALARWLDSHPFTAMQLFHKLREQGYSGGYSMVKDHVRRIRPSTTAAFLTLRFAPGQCAQVDWGSFGSVSVDGTRRALSFFVMVLAHSRWLYVEFTLGQSQEWWLSCHQRAFERLGGVPREVMVDNCKTAVLAHSPGAAPVFNAQYLDFARHHGFQIKACSPAHPQSKGIVENAVAYVKKSFLQGREIGAYAELAPAARLWLDSVANVRASRRCRATIDTNRYSVPPKHAGALLTLQLSSDYVRLYADTALVAEHLRRFGRRLDLENPDHRRELEKRKGGERERLLLRFLALSPEAGAYHQGLQERRMNAGHHLARILALIPTYGEAAVGAAIENAHQLGAYASDYILNLLEQQTRHLPEAGPLHLTRGGDALQLELPAPDLTAYHQ